MKSAILDMIDRVTMISVVLVAVKGSQQYLELYFYILLSFIAISGLIIIFKVDKI
jgi:hypothetical protein